MAVLKFEPLELRRIVDLHAGCREVLSVSEPLPLKRGKFVSVTHRPPLPATHFCQRTGRSLNHSVVGRPHTPSAFTHYSHQAAAFFDTCREFPVPRGGTE
jgi:hypothetical protein